MMFRMSKSKPRRPSAQRDPADAASLELDKLIEQIESAEPAAAGPLWGAAHKLLLRMKYDPSATARIVMARDLAALRIAALPPGAEEPVAAGPSIGVDPPSGHTRETPAAHDIPAETLKKAMHAFRRRLKLVRLDHESRLGVGPMTGGRKAEVDAIHPPREFPEEVWQALVAEGRLQAAGPGFYALPGDVPR